MAQRRRKAASESKDADATPDGQKGSAGSDAQPPSFETTLGRLESLVDRLEQGDLELEESLQVFEEGVGLSKQCAAQLESAERRVEVLIQEGGEWLARPFDVEEGSEEF
jgi:exodeoxyribonuclease VII small subunit